CRERPLWRSLNQAGNAPRPRRIIQLMQRHWPLVAITIALVASLLPRSLSALEYVTIRQGESRREVAGKIEVEAVDGGVMLLARDGALWPITKEELLDRRTDSKPFAPFTREELTKQLATELPGFKSHKTEHYLIHYNTSL